MLFHCKVNGSNHEYWFDIDNISYLHLDDFGHYYIVANGGVQVLVSEEDFNKLKKILEDK